VLLVLSVPFVHRRCQCAWTAQNI